MSVVSHSKKILFVHIARTGGSSVIDCLKKKINDILTIPPHHSTIEKTLTTFPDLYYYYKFSYVRNPYDLLVSTYCNILTSLSNTDYQYIKNLSFQDFVSWIADVGFKREEADGEPFYRTQTNCLFYQGKKIVDDFFKFESLCNDMGTSNLLTIFSKLEIDFQDHIPLLKKSNRSFGYQEYFDSKSYKLVNQIYKEDFKNFKYKMNDF